MQRIGKTLQRYWIYYALFIPVAVYYIMFHYKPLVGVVIAFKDYAFGKGIWGSPWTSEYGFHHFIRFLTAGEFNRVFFNTVILAAMRIAFGFPAPIILALMFNEVRSQKYKKFCRRFRICRTSSPLLWCMRSCTTSSVMMVSLTPSASSWAGIRSCTSAMSSTTAGSPRCLPCRWS